GRRLSSRSCSTRRPSPPTLAAAVCRRRAETARALCTSLPASHPPPSGDTYSADSAPRSSGKKTKNPARRSLAVQQALEADAGGRPVLVGGRAREADDLGGVLDGQAGEIAQLDQPRRLRVLGGQAGQGVVDVQEVVRRRVQADVHGVEVDAAAP